MGDFRDGDAEMAAGWSLSFEDLALLSGKPLSARIGFAAQLLVYRSTGRFPRGGSEISADAAAYIAAQSGTQVSDLADYDWADRSGRRHRAEILKHLGFRRAGRQDMVQASAWIGSDLCPLGLPVGEMMERLLAWFAVRRVASPGTGALTSLIAAARRAFEDQLFSTIAGRLSEQQRCQLDASLADDDKVTGFSGIKDDPGNPDLDNILLLANRLGFVKSLALPVSAMPDPGDPFAQALRRRVANETAWQMRQHPDGRRHALYAFFLAHREREITDGLVDLLVEIVLCGDNYDGRLSGNYDGR